MPYTFPPYILIETTILLGSLPGPRLGLFLRLPALLSSACISDAFRTGTLALSASSLALIHRDPVSVGFGASGLDQIRGRTPALAQLSNKMAKVNHKFRILQKVANPKIGHEGAKAFGDALRINTSLTHLEFCFNNIGNEGARALADALKSNTTLTHLNLNGDQIGDDGAKALADALKSSNSLIKLRLNSNPIGDEGLKALADALTDRRTSAFLYLRNNCIGNWSGSVIANTLTYNNTLRHLDLWGINIANDSRRQIDDLLAQNRRKSSEK